MAAVRVLDQYSVSPPAGSVPETTLPLTFFDLLWLHGRPIERIFFYPFSHSTAHFVEHLLPALKSSLAFTLRHFFTLAGHVRPSPGSDRHFELHYADGDSVQLTLAECDADFDHLSGDHARDLAELRLLVPLLPDSNDDTKPLFALQLTVFPDRGVSLGVALQHVACDGTASTQFWKSWAAACRSSSPPPSPHPVHDRTLISDPKGLYSIWLDSIRARGPNGLFDAEVQQQETVLLSTFALKREHIEALKRRATAGKPPFHCSTFVVACAFTWACLVRTRSKFHGDKTAYFACVVDCRARLEPPVPQVYFGNCLGAIFAEANAHELCGEDGAAVAAEAIGRAIEALGGEPLRGAEEWMPKFTAVAPYKRLSVASSPKFRVYETDFGWGRPEKVEVISIANTGAVCLAESRDGGGGIEIGAAMNKDEMEEFSSHFSDALERLR